MNDWIKFVVEGAPVPKGRPRFGKGKVYTPKRTKAQEDLVEIMGLMEMRSKKLRPFEGRVCLSVEVVQKTPKGDIDNHLKLVSDALNGVCYVDDKQIDELHVWRTVDANQRTIITVSEVLDAG